MAIYFFVVITSIIIGLLVFAFSESKENNCASARGKPNNVEHIIEKPTPSHQNANDLSSAHLNH